MAADARGEGKESAMKIAKHTVVTMDYTLRDDDGDVIDSSAGREPFAYLHGVGSIVPGLERALDGKSTGDTVTVSIPPHDGYGDRDPSLLHVAGREQFPDDADIEIGMQFRVGSEDDALTVTVVGVEGDRVTLDGNHPLAGVTLNFDVKVVGVREATASEIGHGHPHGGGGHHDH
jgi:FKBP-type peptidyl-prolyl cis-trans isomerase SlyD